MMARLGQHFMQDVPLHLIQRGNNREPVFFAAEDYRLYLGWLGEAATAPANQQSHCLPSFPKTPASKSRRRSRTRISALSRKARKRW